MIKIKKCEFAKKKLKFLGHIISREGIRTDLEKIKKMYELIQMENGKYVPFVWNEKRQKAFDEIKRRMTMASIVAHPDFEKSFILYTDASGEGIGAVLHQKDDQGKERIIACASRALNQHEKNYPITEKECLAIVWGIEKFRQYLGVKPFNIIKIGRASCR